MEEVEEEVKVGNVKNYIGRYVIKGVDGHGHSVTRIARKGCFKRMNENVRRRVKLGGEEDVEQGRSLGSAIVALSSLMGVEMEE